MTPRRFPLQAVLDLRTRQRDHAEELLRLALRQLDDAAAALRQAEARLAHLAEELGGQTFTAGQRQRGWHAFVAFQAHSRELYRLQLEAERAVHARRAGLRAAEIERESFCRLESKWLARRASDLAHAEERMLEEFVNARRPAAMLPP